MVTVHLAGGLGNQMFQYAAGRALQIRRNDRLQVEIMSLLRKGAFEADREYALDIFAAAPELTELSKSLITRPGLINAPGFDRFLSHIDSKSRYIHERAFRYDPELFETSEHNISLTDYWQSSKYFEAIGDVIREDFASRVPLSQRGAELARHIISVNSVSLHVRRGDFISGPVASNCHGFTEIDYYYRAIKLLNERRLPDTQLSRGQASEDHETRAYGLSQAAKHSRKSP